MDRGFKTKDLERDIQISNTVCYQNLLVEAFKGKTTSAVNIYASAQFVISTYWGGIELLQYSGGMNTR